jgi:hypothetical protein
VSAIAGPSAAARSVRIAAVALAVVAVALAEEAVVSGPIVASAALFGPALTAAVFVVGYGAAGALLATLAARAYHARLQGRPGRLERWIGGQADSRLARWAGRALAKGGWIAFPVASILLGPIVTTWLVRSAGRGTSAFPSIAVASSALWVVPFVGMYCGLTGLVVS